jgi:hypothetical protein
VACMREGGTGGDWGMVRLGPRPSPCTHAAPMETAMNLSAEMVQSSCWWMTKMPTTRQPDSVVEGPDPAATSAGAHGSGR